MTPILRSNLRNVRTSTTSKKTANSASIATPKSSKRTLSPDQNTAKSVSSKKTKSNDRPTMEIEELKNFITASLANIESKIDSSQKSLENKFGDLAQKVNNDVSAMKTTVAEFHTKINDELNAVKTQLSHYSDRLDNNDDDFQRTQRNHDLRMTGYTLKTRISTTYSSKLQQRLTITLSRITHYHHLNASQYMTKKHRRAHQQKPYWFTLLFSDKNNNFTLNI